MLNYGEIFAHESEAFVFEDVMEIELPFSIQHCESCAETLAEFGTKAEAREWLEFVISDGQLNGHPTNLGY